MFRTLISWHQPPVSVRVRARSQGAGEEAARSAVNGFPHSLPDLTGQVPKAAPSASAPATADLSALLETLRSSLDRLHERRQQTLSEMQQVTIELAVAAASQLVFEVIDRSQFGVERLVQQALEKTGLQENIQVALHPADAALLRQRPEGRTLLEHAAGLTVVPDPSINRGGCRVETSEQVLVSEITLRLSEIRRHWMEELDDSQVERRHPQPDARALRRFPDRRETA